MDGSNANPTDRPDNPEWYFLSEFSMSEFLLDHDRSDALKAGLLFQTMRELDMSLEWVENIEMTLAGFANEAMAHFKQGSLEISGRIRIFCQKKIASLDPLGRRQVFVSFPGASASPPPSGRMAASPMQ